jgi:hypothetical protein
MEACLAVLSGKSLAGDRRAPPPASPLSGLRDLERDPCGHTAQLCDEPRCKYSDCSSRERQSQEYLSPGETERPLRRCSSGWTDGSAFRGHVPKSQLTGSGPRLLRKTAADGSSGEVTECVYDMAVQRRVVYQVPVGRVADPTTRD